MTTPHARQQEEAATSPPRPRVTAVIPAYNSADCIADTIRNLRRQTLPPNAIIVVANNCTDDTASIAEQCGARVRVMPNNPHKKAGALNNALDWLLPLMGENDFVIIQDDDTEPDPDFIRQAVIKLTAPRNRADAVGPVFYGREGGGILGQLQRNEYTRFAASMTGRPGKDVIVLSGTAAVFRADTLQGVAKAMRNGRFDGEGSVYNILSQTEDHYLTLVLHQLGYRTAAPRGCRVVTDVMTSIGALWHQRIRWQHGTIDDLRSFGWCKVTREAILRQIVTALLITFTLLYPVYLGGQYHQFGVVAVNPTRHAWWFALGVFVLLERVSSVRSGGWKAMLLAALLFPEWLYDTFRQIVFLTALCKSIKGSAARWVHT
jgi:cellulose synthase/poly-beta-1,6-N-acetylglucosamine synthase-like glycosyltransferase